MGKKTTVGIVLASVTAALMTFTPKIDMTPKPYTGEVLGVYQKASGWNDVSYYALVKKANGELSEVLVNKSVGNYLKPGMRIQGHKSYFGSEIIVGLVPPDNAPLIMPFVQDNE